MTEKEFNQIFSENLNYYMAKTGTSRGDLARLLNVSLTSVPNWCNALKTPRMDKVDKICQHFGVKRSALMSENPEVSAISTSASSFHLSASEQTLLREFRQLNSEGQDKAIDYVSDLVSTGRYIKDVSNISETA